MNPDVFRQLARTRGWTDNEIEALLATLDSSSISAISATHVTLANGRIIAKPAIESEGR